jgi:CDP-6-deoxy-D-xylo-4-hexulose-3-dehydrase
MLIDGRDKFYVPGGGYIEEGNSSFCFPLIAKTPLIKDALLRRLRQNFIEYRPVVGGNLLRQPYMTGYGISGKAPAYNVDIVHENGIYIGNNQFVSDRELNILEGIIRSL